MNTVFERIQRDIKNIEQQANFERFLVDMIWRVESIQNQRFLVPKIH